MDKEERDFQPLLKGRECEKDGDIDNAIKMYEKLVNYKFDGSFPYDRLCIIYRKRKDYLSEERILLSAITVFSKIVSDGYRDDGPPKLLRYQKRLDSLRLKYL